MLIKLIRAITVCCCLNSVIGITVANETSDTTTGLDTSRIIRIALPDEASLQAATPERFQLLVNFLKEYWQIWAIDHQITIKFIYLPTVEALEQLQDHQLDIVAINIFQKEYRHLLYSIPYAKFKQSIYRNINQNEADGIHIAIHGEDRTALNYLPARVKRSYFTDIKQLLSNYQEYDAIYSTRPWLLESKLEELGLRQQFSLNQQEVPEINIHFTTRADDRVLLNVINDGIRHVKIAQAKLWSNKYLLNDDSNILLTMGEYIKNLSEQEKQYVIDHTIITYPVSEEGLPPFIITNNFLNITERGFTSELISFAGNKLGIIFQPLYVKDHHQALAQLTQNKAQLLVNMEHKAQLDPQLSDKLIYSIPYLKTQYSIAYNPSGVVFDTSSSLKNLTIATVNNSNTAVWLAQQYPQSKLVMFDTLQAAISAVADGKADAFVGRSLTTSYLIKQYRLSNLTSHPLINFHQNAQFSFAAQQTESTLISLLNKAISSLSADQFATMYAKWSQSAFPVANVQAQIDTAYRQASYVFLTILLIALIIFWVYYRQLQVRKISQRKIEHALAIAEAARQEAERSAQAKITFLTRMSHEIRTPMNGVLGMTEALNYTPLNQEQSELLETLEGSARHLLALLNDVLDFSKMDAGKLTLESVPVNLHLLAKNVVKSFQHIEQQNDIKVQLEIDPKITHSYYTDPTRLNQILNNLMSNAIKFTESGVIKLSIMLIKQSIEDHDTYDTLAISVSDTGIGISMAKQQQLFTPFIQADSDTTRKYGGTGLGLSICQEIVVAMGGKIQITSSVGQGSRFYFDLTFKQADVEHDIEDRRKNNRVMSPPHDDRFANLRVLVAEDNLVNVKVLTAQLARLNIHADVAYDGLEALSKHQQAPYDIIISDCHMPNMDGFELAKAIIKQQRQPIWLIAVTADALSGAAEKCLASGFDDYMAKPCPQEEITNKLNHAYRQLQQKKAMHESSEE